MIYEFRLPKINPYMTGARLECVFASVGEPLKTGAKLIDISVDLSDAFAQECPPVSFFRVVLREPAYLRAVYGARGEVLEVGELLALFSSAPDEDLSQAPARAVRFATAGIVHHEGLWTGSIA